MQSRLPQRSRPAVARDAALRRLRRVTRIAIAVMVSAAGAFAALAAGSTQTKKTVLRPTARKARASVLIQAPAPPLVAAQPESAPQSPAPTAPAPPVSVPAPSYSPPVVVSGGS
jgi:hypothetical protein